MSLPDSNCVKMLDLGVVPHILNLLERHVDQGDVSIQHAGLSALRNLAIPGALKPSFLRHFNISFGLLCILTYTLLSLSFQQGADAGGRSG